MGVGLATCVLPVEVGPQPSIILPPVTLLAGAVRMKYFIVEAPSLKHS